MHQRSDTTGIKRRDVLRAGGTAAIASVAGCAVLGEAGPSTTNDEAPVAVASFFSFFDFARHVVAETPVEVRNLVPTGLHGHGWEPNAAVTRDIIEADAFIYVGEGFQPWADRAIQTIRDDDVDTALVNVREDIDLLPLATSLDRDEEGVGKNQGMDPHFWLDPRRAKVAVNNITEGLVDLAPDHADTIRSNAAAYKTDRLEQIDRDYAAVFDTADKEVIQLAAHNAFQYIGARYNVRMRPLVTNLAASGDVKPSDIREAKGVIEENNIQYIGAGVFESRRPARQLLAETPVKAYFPVTPYAGVREEWVEQNWGYEEIAYNINMPTFDVVLGNTPVDEAGPGGWANRWRNFE